MGGMERVNRIWNHPAYQEALGKLTAYEAEREFCRHTPEHFLAVARLTYLLALENGVEIGFALFFHNFSTFLGRAGLYLEDLYVKPEARGKGYGKAI